MTTPPRTLGPFPTAVRATLLALALALVTVAAGAPAAALRSGPDVAVQADAETLRTSGGGVRTPSTAGAASSAGRNDPAATGYVPPVPGVDPPFGVERRFDPPEQEWGAGHRGVDLLAPAGTRVVSPGPGVVTFAGQVARRGVVVVTHLDGLRSSLEPVAASVPTGTAVTAGTAIGVVEGARTGDGDPGDRTAPNHCAPQSCVHWGVRRGERYLDPLSLLDRPPIVLLPDR
ncbi:M23 family metallopeptidase [Promicromonospora sp. Populi]|uniref:M23 family metallopeptidase n=1 Tax=Promicromonospora sp. Populi TaxID=3239420 RepID=UPI0034E1A29C